MHIKNILESRKPVFSFEFFPPKNASASEQLFHTIADLVPLQPSYVSITYGAGGSTRELTHDMVVRIQKETRLTVCSHLTCVGASRDEIAAILDRYAANGIENILALHGDPPQGQPDWKPSANGFAHAADLVRFIRARHPSMGIGVAGFPEGHPASANRLVEIDFLKEKMDAGADYICTQLFFDNRDFYDFRERCEIAGITQPILAGIMPIQTLAGMKRMAELSPRSHIPAKLLRAVLRSSHDDAVARFGVHWATEQVRDLIDHDVAGIHFYTLNKSAATRDIYRTLDLK